MREEIYDIGGMHCAACSSAVERVTRKLPGVKNSDVNLPLNRLTITYDEEITSSDDIISKIKRAGFSATIHRREEHSSEVPENDLPVETSGVAFSSAKEDLFGERTSLVVSLTFAGLLLIISMGHMIIPGFPPPGYHLSETHPANMAILQLILATPVLFLNRRFFREDFSLFRGNPNMDTLVALSASASLFTVL